MRNRSIQMTRLFVLVTLWLPAVEGWQPAATADERATELSAAELISQEVGLYVELREPLSEDTLARTRPIVERVRKWEPFRRWRGTAEFQNLASLKSNIEVMSGKPLLEVVRMALGDRNVLAVFPQADGKTSTLLMFEFRSPEHVQSGLELWRRLDRREEQTSDHQGIPVTERISSKKSDQPQFIAVLDRRVVISDRIEQLRDAIDRWQAARAGKSLRATSLSELPSYLRLMKSADEESSLLAFANPRVWPDKSSDRAPGDPVEAWLQQKFGSCDGLLLTLVVHQGLELTAHASTDEPLWLPRGAVASDSQRPPAPSDNALLAAGGRINGRLLAQAAQEIVARIPQDQRKQIAYGRTVISGLLMQHDPIDDVLPQIGPYWQAELTPSSSAVLLDGSFELQLAERSPEFRSHNRLHFAMANATATVLQMGLTRLKRDDLPLPEVSFQHGPEAETVGVDLTALWPDVGFELRCEPHRVVLRSTGGQGGEERNELQRDAVESSDFWMHLEIKRIRQWIGDHTDRLSEALAAERRLTIEQAGERLQRLQTLLQLVDRVSLTVDTESRHSTARLVLHIDSDP